MTTSKFPKIKFHLDTAQSCCGNGFLYDFEELYQKNEYSPGKGYKVVPGGFNTRKQMVDDFLTRLKERLHEDAADHWEDDDDCGNDRPEYCYAYLTLNLFRGQINPGGKDFIDDLVENGWQILLSGKNPKTDNVIVNMGFEL